MADNLFLDGDLVTLLEEHFDEINLARKIAQASAVQEYEQFMKLPAAH
jgi:hypothetical protein